MCVRCAAYRAAVNSPLSRGGLRWISFGASLKSSVVRVWLSSDRSRVCCVACAAVWSSSSLVGVRACNIMLHARRRTLSAAITRVFDVVCRAVAVAAPPLQYAVLSCPILSYPVLSCPTLPVLASLILLKPRPARSDQPLLSLVALSAALLTINTERIGQEENEPARGHCIAGPYHHWPVMRLSAGRRRRGGVLESVDIFVQTTET